MGGVCHTWGSTAGATYVRTERSVGHMHIGCGILWAGASRRVCLLPWLRCSFILGCVIIYAFMSVWKSFLDVDSNHKRSYRFFKYLSGIYQICVCLLRHVMLSGNVERGGRTGVVNVLRWHTIKGSSMAESDSLVAPLDKEIHRVCNAWCKWILVLCYSPWLLMQCCLAFNCMHTEILYIVCKSIGILKSRFKMSLHYIQHIISSSVLHFGSVVLLLFI